MRPRPRANIGTPAPARDSDRSSPPPSRNRYQILLDAEVARLVHELRPFGVLRERTLAQRAGCGAWPAGAFHAALRDGARHGKLVLLPFDFVGLPRSKAAAPRSRVGRRSRSRPERQRPTD
jgi:hypothetical protein